MWYRFSRRDDDYCIECSQDGENYTQMRVCHMWEGAGYYRWNSRNTGDIGTDAVIYSPGVTVFKTDDTIPELLEMNSWFQVDVITCAAPYYDKEKKKPLSKEKLREVFCKRIENRLLRKYMLRLNEMRAQ